MNVHVEDLSAQMFGKYQHCTGFEGKWYADCDYEHGNGCGPLKDGAVARCGFVYHLPPAIVVTTVAPTLRQPKSRWQRLRDWFSA